MIWSREKEKEITPAPHAEPPQRRLEDQVKGQETLIAQESQIQGTIKGAACIRVAGFLEGEVKISGVLTIEPNGRIKGNVQAGGAIIEGEINGNIESNGRVEVRRNGRVLGNIQCAKIAVAEGCFFQGEIKMPKTDEMPKTFAEKRKPEEPLK